MYEVIRFFTDLQDNEYPYNPGDIFPREGMEVTKERIAELSGSENKQCTPLIKKITDDDEMEYTKSKINRMNTTELQNLAASRGIEGAFDMTGTDLKKRLISDMGL